MHFLFSCRVLNMGVEQWIYNRLGRPELTINGEVSDDPKSLAGPGLDTSRRSRVRGVAIGRPAARHTPQNAAQGRL